MSKLIWIDKGKYHRYLRFGSRVKVYADRWPWSKKRSSALLDGGSMKKIGETYGWLPNKGMGRFGGGWEYELGIQIGGSSVMINLLVGYVCISWHK